MAEQGGVGERSDTNLLIGLKSQTLIQKPSLGTGMLSCDALKYSSDIEEPMEEGINDLGQSDFPASPPRSHHRSGVDEEVEV